MIWLAFNPIQGVNNDKETVVSFSSPAAYLADVTPATSASGFNWYGTKAEALAHPNIVSNAYTQNNARDVINAAGSGGLHLGTGLASTAQTGASSASSAVNSAFSIGGINGTNLAIRLVKVFVGGILLLIGLAKITGMDQKAGSLAAKAVKVAPLL